MDDIEAARAALNMGVYDYVTKPFERSRVLITVVNALRRRELEALGVPNRPMLTAAVLVAHLSPEGETVSVEWHKPRV